MSLEGVLRDFGIKWRGSLPSPGNNIKSTAPCPFCQGTACISVLIEEKFALYKCHKCDESGRINEEKQPEPRQRANGRDRANAADKRGGPQYHPEFGKASCAYPYHSADGELLFYVVRWNVNEQRPKKIFRQWSALSKTWQRGVDPPLPLRRLPALLKWPKDKFVVLVEGEKAAIRGQEVMSAFFVTCWPGGTGGVDKVDFSPLRGRRLLLIPDYDDQGRTAMRAVQNKIGGKIVDGEMK